jgi:hypothetical protein
MARIIRKAEPGATRLFAAHANYSLAPGANIGILALSKRRQAMTYIANSKAHEVKQTGTKFFYWSPRALRWLPVAKSKVQF